MALLSTSQRSYLNGISPFAIEMSGLSVGSRLANLNTDGLYVGPANGKGNAWFADSTVASSGAGTSWGTAFKTVAEAYTAAAAGDTIYMQGSFSEAAVVATKAGLSFIGVGNATKQCQWTSAADTKTLTLGANYIAVENIYFKPPTYTAGIPASIALSGANYAQIIGNRFQGQTGSWNAIYSAVCDSDNVTIAGNEFMYLNTATYGCGILGVEAGGLSYSGWTVAGNRFSSCVTAMNFNGRACRLIGNTVNIGGITAAGAANAAVCTMAIDLSGTSSGGNMVTDNTLAGAYTTALYVPGATGDCWIGNKAAITVTTAPNGLSVANPAA